MKFDRRVLALSLLFGLGAAVLDNILDGFFFYDGSFWDLLLFDVPPVELYVRFFIIGTFLLFGAIVSNMVYRRRRAEERLEHSNRVLRAVREVNHLIALETDPNRLLDAACEVLVSTRGYHNVWAVRMERGRPAEPFHQAGFAGDFAPMAARLRKGAPPPCAQRTMTDGEVELVADPARECGSCPNVAFYPERAGMAACMVHNGNVLGWVTVSVPRAYASDPREHELLQDVAADLGRALWTLQADDRRRQEAEASFAALQESEERFRNLADLLPEAVFEADLEANLTYVNRRAFVMFGYTPGDFDAGLNGIQMLVPEDRAKASARVADRLAGKHGSASEYRALRKDGSTFPVLFHADPVERGGQTVGLRGLLVDITERKEAEEEILSSARRMANFVDSSPMGVLQYELRADETLVLVGANPAADRMLGGRISAMAGRTIQKVFPGLAETGVPERFREAARDGTMWHARRFPYRLEEEPRVYEVVAFQTAPREMAVMFLDVTEQDAAEAALRESEARFRGVIEQINDAVYIVFDDRFDLVNQRFCEMTGATRQEIRAPDFDLWNLVAPESRAHVKERQAARARSEEVPAVYPFTILRRDRTRIQVEASVIEIDYRGGKAVLGLLRDVTEQKSLEEQLHQAQKMESIGRLSGGVAHDLNNFLTPILGFGEILTQELPEEDDRRQFAEDIVQAAFRARELVRQLLAFGRRQTLEFKPLDLNILVTDFEGLLRRTIRENVRMNLELATSLPTIQADRGQLEQVLMNLAINASDAMPQGGTLLLETGVAEFDPAYASSHPGVVPGRYAVLSVSDTGSGMDATTQAQVFEPFFTTKEKGRGTGLGLATTYGIVKQHRGNIWVYSEPGQGTTFRCYFPVAGEGRQDHSERTDGAHELSSLRGTETIVVVEDEESVRALTVGVLQRQGYEVMSATDGPSCLAALAEREDTVSLLLTDVGLPGMNGRALYREVARLHPSVRVLFMSGYSEEVVTHEGVLEDGIELIQKPFSVRALAERVRRVLDA